MVFIFAGQGAEDLVASAADGFFAEAACSVGGGQDQDGSKVFSDQYGQKVMDSRLFNDL